LKKKLAPLTGSCCIHSEKHFFSAQNRFFQLPLLSHIFITSLNPEGLNAHEQDIPFYSFDKHLYAIAPFCWQPFLLKQIQLAETASLNDKGALLKKGISEARSGPDDE
jgi:hypothetical protein